ncbi:protein Spindly [Sabethes cyaneus]|uniref:protein Spindly n=1 Tax=Sabethes cyaneus TaxID=53552 RepID=UPI00237D6CDA|nr:protein Spindly [Sabethes cyaneus]
MSANDTIVKDITSLSKNTLIEQYQYLADNYKSLKRTHEEELQASYELRRNYQTASESVAYMTAELESIDSVHKAELAKLKEKYVQTLTTLKDSNADLKQQNSALETTIDEIQKQCDLLKERVQELEQAEAGVESVRENETISSEKEILERENEELKALISDQQEKLDTLMLQLVNVESRFENMNEKLACLEDNLTAKRQELDEARIVLESTQEENMQLNSELAALRSAPDDPNKKGNSLFAEVHDQRQKLIEKLESQRKHYQEMKKQLSESQIQIRRLTRENRELCGEIQDCSQMFFRSDQTFRVESSKQINSLREENQRLHDQIASANRRLLDRTADSQWVDSFVSFYKNEHSTLKAQLFQLQMAKRTVDEICWDAQCDLAKWRFEALKSRYIISNRESLLEEHNVVFPSFNALHIHIDDQIVANAKPNVGWAVENTQKLRQNDQYLGELDLLSDLEPKLPTLKSSITSQPVIMQAPPPPPLSIANDVKPSIKEEPLTPLATPFVTPVQSPKSLKKETSALSDSKQRTEEKSNSALKYRDIVFIPKNAPLSDSLKKKNVELFTEKVTTGCQQIKLSKEMPADLEKENVANSKEDDKSRNAPQTKAYGFVSEKRTKNNIVIRRFKFPNRIASTSTQKE